MGLHTALAVPSVSPGLGAERAEGVVELFSVQWWLGLDSLRDENGWEAVAS